MRVDQQTFLRLWAGSSAIPGLLVWGMRHGSFERGPLSVDRIAAETGYTVEQVRAMIKSVDRHLERVQEGAENRDKTAPDYGHWFYD